MKKITAILLSAVLTSAPVSAVTANAETAEGNYAESYENVLKGFAGENYIHLSFWDQYYGNTAHILDTANKIHIIPSSYHGTVITVEEGTELPVEEITDAAFIAGSATPEITKVDNDTYTLEAIRSDQRKLFYDALKSCDCVSRIEEKLVTYEDTVNAFAVQQWYIKTDKGPEALTEEYPELDLVYSPKFKKDAERQGFDYCYTGGLDLSNAYDTLTNMAESGYGFMLSGIMTCLGQDITEEHECTRIVYTKENSGTSGTMRSPENVEEYLRESYEKRIPLDKDSALFTHKCDEAFMIPDDDHGAVFYFIESYPEMINFKVPKETDRNLIKQIVSEVDDKLVFECETIASGETYNCSVKMKDGAIGSVNVKKLYNRLSDVANDLIYRFDQSEITYSACPYLTEYDLYINEKEITEKLDEYLKDNNVKAALVKQSERNTLRIVPDDDLSFTEHYDLAQDIKDKTGLMPYGFSDTGVPPIIGKTIHLNNYVNGDANCDKGVGLADALAILQYVANAEKYPLTTQGLFNADIVGEGDGITPLDALEIQKWDANYGNPYSVPQSALE
ncbi:hypothetical protein [Ruminococcus sp. XPD3002]|uniref:hypothetical protein n=1 Tax=Ruminococcus sp. XPD3002 TaxID=1452269 RepID=UPI0009107EBB|nr:hypothetical protein SAMN04487832_1044 [Ruminococcus flavefaciens]